VNSNDFQFEFEGTVVKVDINDRKLIHLIKLNRKDFYIDEDFKWVIKGKILNCQFLRRESLLKVRMN